MMNAGSRFTGVVVIPAAYLRSKKRVLNLKQSLYGFDRLHEYSTTSWLKSSIDPITMSTAY